MIQSGEDQYKEEVKALWKICFPEDPDAFIQFYFDKIYTNENTLLLLEGGKVVSSLQMLPYQIKFNSSIEFAGYISGAMTHPDFQKRGFMSQLLISSFEKMKENNYKYSFLIPQEDWLFGFYGQYGYKEAFPVYQAKTFDHSQSSILSNLKNETMHLCDKFQGLDVSKLYITYSRLLMEKNNVVLKTKENLMNILWDFFEDKGILMYNDRGIAFIYPLLEKVFIREFFFYNGETEQAFLTHMAKSFPGKEIIYQNNPNAPFLKYKGMIKGLDENIQIVPDIYMGMMLD